MSKENQESRAKSQGKSKKPSQSVSPADQDEQIQSLNEQVGQLTQALQRERADAVNSRRLFEQQMSGLRSSVKADTVRDLLPVIDNFERALRHVPQNLADDDYVKGIQGIVKQFEKTLEQLGVEKIKTVGESFDPNLHEAVSMEEGDGDYEVVSEELQSGYILGDQVLRHAMVRVKRQA